jgi:hypothetical protein
MTVTVMCHAQGTRCKEQDSGAPKVSFPTLNSELWTLDSEENENGD